MAWQILRRVVLASDDVRVMELMHGPTAGPPEKIEYVCELRDGLDGLGQERWRQVASFTPRTPPVEDAAHEFLRRLVLRLGRATAPGESGRGGR